MKGEGSTQRLEHFLYRVGIMRAIDDDGWIVPHNLDASRPVYGGKAATERILIPYYALPTQLFKGCQRHRGILQLIAPDQRYFKVGVGRFRRPDGKALFFLVVRLWSIAIAYDWTDTHHTGLTLAADGCNSQQRLGRLSRGHYNAIGLDNTRFLGRNFGKRITQNMHMIVANRGDHRDKRLKNIGSVQPSAQSNFYDCMLYLLAIEEEKSQSRSDLIGNEWAKLVARLDCLNGGLYLRYQLCNLFFADEMTIDAHTFAKGVQIGLRIEAGTQASLAQHALD